MLLTNLHKKITAWKQQKLWRNRMVVQQRDANKMTSAGKTYLDFSNNDYLGLHKHPQIDAAFMAGVKKYGLGSTSASVVSGYYAVHQKLEQQFAEWLGVEKAILFNSGYLANLGVMTGLLNRESCVVSDKFCHASLLDGIQLSRAKHYRYQHNSPEDLQKFLTFTKPEVLVTESVFSMEGDKAKVAEIFALTSAKSIITIVDEAHSIGVLGPDGRGLCAEENLLPHENLCLVMPLGKAFNAMGAIVAGSEKIIDPILQFSRSYRYTTALPPAIAYALLATLELVKTEQWRRDKLNENIHFFNTMALDHDLVIAADDITPVRSIIIGNAEQVLAVQQAILDQGFYVSAIRSPTVPEGTARLRISLNSLHSQQQIRDLLHTIQLAVNSLTPALYQING